MLDLIAASFPFASLFLLMVVLKRPAYISATVTLLGILALAFYYWQMPGQWLNVSLAKGLFIAIEILFIVFGAVFLLSVLQKTNIFSHIFYVLDKVSKDHRIQTILVGWFFVSFVEGVAGFGTPAMLAAPILVFAGLSPLVAVIIALLGNSVGVTFGAVGVPITVGIYQGLSSTQISMLGDFLPDVSTWTAFIHLIIGSFIPLLMSCLVTYLTIGSFRKGLEIWKYAIFAGFAFTIPYFMSAVFLGPEFPTVVGSIVGLFLVLIVTKEGFFVPKEKLRLFKPILDRVKVDVTAKSMLKAVAPYIILVFLLGLSRIEVIGFGPLLKQFTINFSGLFGTDTDHVFTPLYSPGFFFAVVSVISMLMYKLPRQIATEALEISFKRTLKPFIALFSILGIVNVLLFSSNNLAGLPSIPMYLAESMVSVGWAWPLVAPIVGVLGSFIAGSSTVSNLLFSSLHVEAAVTQGMPPSIILALQSVGSSVGNMIAIHNVLAALAVVGLADQERHVIKFTIFPSLVYAFIAGIVGMLIIYL
jgi:lactate permease